MRYAIPVLVLMAGLAACNGGAEKFGEGVKDLGVTTAKLADLGVTAAKIANSAGGAVAAVAPFLPGPLGGIVAGGATVLTLLGGLFAKRRVETVRATAGANPAAINPLTKALSERKWLFPIVAAIIAGGNAANLWHVDPEKLWTLIGALGLPSAMEFVKDAKTTAARV